jgi:triacylglycerol esterase/lipase EstA (alpha/beta hydrolase family)
MIHHHAQTLLTNLTLERKSRETTHHPIIFVCHSLGGILVKKALEISEGNRGKNTEDLRLIFVSTYGVMFLGTPHNGADPAKLGLTLQGMVSMLVPKGIIDTEVPLVRTL